MCWLVQSCLCVWTDLLPQPYITLSDGVFEAYQQGFRVLLGSDFTITCSVQPQYPGSSFQLISDTTESITRTLPAVNHSAHFLLSAAGYAHRGNYTCVYHVDVNNHSFSSSHSPALYLTVGGNRRTITHKTPTMHQLWSHGHVSQQF